jgi:serine protease
VATATYEQGAGTSFASPLVTGVVSLIRTVASGLTPAATINLIKNQTRPHTNQSGLSACSSTNTGNCNCTTSTCGVGLLDAALAIQAAKDYASLPTARLETSGQAVPGGTLWLDARSSTALSGSGATLLSFNWAQEQGLPLTLQNPTSAVVQVSFPASATGSYVLAVKVTDDQGRTDTARQTITMPSPSTDSGSSGGAMDSSEIMALLASYGLWRGIQCMKKLMPKSRSWGQDQGQN